MGPNPGTPVNTPKLRTLQNRLEYGGLVIPKKGPAVGQAVGFDPQPHIPVFQHRWQVIVLTHMRGQRQGVRYMRNGLNLELHQRVGLIWKEGILPEDSHRFSSYECSGYFG